MARSKQPPPSASAPAAFTGFAKDAPGFFHELAATQSRDWWQAHKDDYERLWVAPMTALLAAVRAGLAPAYRGLTLAEPKLFRIHRDVRFGKDKSPYKTHCAGVVSTTAGPTMESGAAVYLQLGLDEFAGAGFYTFTPEQLARWRKAVLDPRRGAEVARRVDAAIAAGLTLDAGAVLTKVPHGLDPAHPRALLLRHKGCVFGFPAIPRGAIHTPGLATWLVAQARLAAPVVSWLQAHVA